MNKKSEVRKAFKAALPHTIPIFAGFLFLGIAYGIYMKLAGFSAIYPILMSMTIFAGSMEFVAADLLLGAFNPVGAFVLTLMVNARHLFYGISMLDKYKDVGKKKWYLIFGMCDETFSINCTAQIPVGVDKGWLYFFVTLLNYLYWVLGASVGGIFGSFINIKIEGIDFIMTALIVVIFLEQCLKEKDHTSAVIGIGATILCRIIFGADNFIIPSMIMILGVLTLFRNQLQRRVEE